MNIQDKKLQTIIPGFSTGVNVVDGDISFAMGEFKRVMKDSNKLLSVYDNRCYVKPSVTKRKMIDTAKFNQRKLSNKDR